MNGLNKPYKLKPINCEAMVRADSHFKAYAQGQREGLVIGFVACAMLAAGIMLIVSLSGCATSGTLTIPEPPPMEIKGVNDG